MKTISLVALAVLLSACSGEQRAIEAGTIAVATARVCLDHIKVHRNTDIPQCNATREYKAYSDIRKELTAPVSAAIREIDKELKATHLEALELYKQGIAR